MSRLSNKQVKLARFVGLYAGALILLVIIFSAFTSPSPRVIYRETIKDDPAMTQQIRELEYTVASKDKQLEDARTAATVTDSGDLEALKAQLQAKDQQIALLLKTPAANDAHEAVIQQLQNDLRAKDTRIASLSKPVAVPATTAPANTAEISRLKNQLKEKDAQIASLSRVSKPTQPVVTGDAAELAELRQRNENLSKGFNSLATQVGVLTKSNNLLKIENKGLQSKIQDLSNH